MQKSTYDSTDRGHLATQETKHGAMAYASSPPFEASPPSASQNGNARKSKLSLKRTISPDDDDATNAIRPNSGGKRSKKDGKQASADSVLFVMPGGDSRYEEHETREQTPLQEKQRDQMREEEELRIQARWSQEELLTLCTSRVPASRSCGRQHGHAQHRAGEIGIAKEAKDTIECIDLVDSSQECDREGEKGAQGELAPGGGEEQERDGRREDVQVSEDDDWDWDDEGVILEEEPDDEDLGVDFCLSRAKLHEDVYRSNLMSGCWEFSCNVI